MLKNRLPLATILTSLCLFAAPAFAGGEGWTEDYEAAKTQAAEQGKDLFFEFTGSDWCPPCKALNKMVFSHDSFVEAAGEHFVLVKLDFPRSKEQSEALKTQNRSLQKKYAIRAYPTILLTDASGLPYAQTGFRKGGPEEYMAHLQELMRVRVERDEHLAAAEKAEGIEKAKHLFAAMQAVGDDMALFYYKDTVAEIIELDSDSEAGLKKHYEDIEKAKKQRLAFRRIMHSAKDAPEAAIAKLDEMVASEETLTSVKQEAIALKSQIQIFVIKDREAGKATLIQAIEIDPESKMAEKLKHTLKQFFGESV